MKNILFVMPKFAPGGAEKSLLMLLHELSKLSDLEIDLLLFKHEGAFLEQLPPNINVIEAEYSLRVIYSKFDISNCNCIKGCILSTTRLLGTIISRIVAKSSNHRNQIRWSFFYKKVININPKGYDIACGYLDGESVYYVVDKVNAKIKIGWNQNDYDKLGFQPSFDKFYMKELDKVVTLTDRCEIALSNQFPEIVNKIVQIPPIVSNSFIYACANDYFPSEYSEINCPILVSVGRLVSQKGFDLAISAAQILKDKNIEFRWFIIGNGELLSELSRDASARDLNDKLVFLGEKSNPYPYIQNSTIFVQTSRFEGKSVILNETKILCKPIVVTNYQTVLDQIKDGVNGYICEMNSNAIADRIEQLIFHAEYRERVIRNLKKENYSDNFTVNKYLELFEL